MPKPPHAIVYNSLVPLRLLKYGIPNVKCMGKMSDLIEENAAQSVPRPPETAETAEQTQQSHELSTVERAELLMEQDEAIAEHINNDASSDEAIDPSNSQFGPCSS